MTLGEEIARHDTEDALRSEVRSLSRKLSDLRQKHIELEDVIREAAEVSFTQVPPPVVPTPRKDRRKGKPEVAVAMVADLQLGKVTPDYDTEVAEQRMGVYADKVLELTEIQRQAHPVEELRVWLLGDIVEGEDIFPGQAHLIDSSLLDQVITNGARILRDFLTRLAANYRTVHVAGVVGNHGRVGRRGVFHPNTNADRMLYLVTREMTPGRVTWEIPSYHKGDRGWYTVDKIGSYRSLLVHGDQFRGGNSFAGLPFYSFAKKALAWRDMSLLGDMPPFDDIACGHWHQIARIPVGTVTVRVAGSPESYNAWSIETLAKSARPAQYLMFVSPSSGRVTAEYEVDLR